MNLPAQNHPAVDSTINFDARLIPLPGNYWVGEGGIYVGSMRDGDSSFHIIQALTELKGTWGKHGEEIPGKFSISDGAHNTRLILAAEPDNAIATQITNLVIEGHTDFHWASPNELALCRINGRENGSKGWHWSSAQSSARYAWVTGFENGNQDTNGKGITCAVRAVRRLPI